MQLLIKKARVTDPQSDYNGKVVDLLVEDRVITKIASTIKGTPQHVVAHKDLMVSPGWVDVMADYREPGFEHKETISTGLEAAAAGGFTDVLLAPNTQPALSSQSTIKFVLQKAAGHAVNLHPTGAASRNVEGKELAEMLDMRANGAIAFGDGWKPIQNANLAMKAMEYLTAFNGVLVQVPVEASLAAGGLMHEGVMSTTLGMAGIPPLAETLMVYRDIELARYTRSRLHISGISTAAAVEMVKRAKAEGLPVTCSVTPYHLALTDDALRTYNSAYKVTPPLRTESDRQALLTALHDGVIDCIATHHRPHEWDAKTKEFDYASEGMAIQELAFAILCSALPDTVTIDRLVAAMTLVPRDVFGLPERVIATGSEACLTLFVTGGSYRLERKDARSIAYNNPFLGQALPAKVVGIVNNAQLKQNNW